MTGMGTELQWEHRSGRDKEGDKYSHYSLIQTASTRILAKVYEDCGKYEFSLSFFYGQSHKGRRLDKLYGEYRFMELEGAKRFVERIVEEAGQAG